MEIRDIKNNKEYLNFINDNLTFKIQNLEEYISNGIKDKGKKVEDDFYFITNCIKTANVLNISFSEFKEVIDGGFLYDQSKTDYYNLVANIMSYMFNLNKINHYTVEEEVVNNWDEYFYNVAKQTARNSKCFSRKIGAVLVKDNTIIGTGYNSPPRGIPPCDKRWGFDRGLDITLAKEDVVGKCPRKVLGYKSGEGIELCTASHAEESAIVNSARMGISTNGASLYLTCEEPCVKCAVKIINSGIKEVVVTSFNSYDKVSNYLFSNSNIILRKYNF